MSANRIEIKAYSLGDEAMIAHFLRNSKQRFNLADMPVSAEDITEENLIKFVFKNPNFKPKDVFEVWKENEFLGIMFIRKHNEKGQIPVFVIKESQLEKIGNLLLIKAEEIFSTMRVKAISIGGGAPYYPLISWLRSDEEQALIQFLLSQGFSGGFPRYFDNGT